MIKNIIPALLKDFFHIQNTKWVIYYEYHKECSYCRSGKSQEVSLPFQFYQR